MLGQGVGLSREEIAGMGNPEEYDSFSDIDRLVLKYAEELTLHNRVDDELYDQLKTYFSSDELMELCGSVGLSALVNRFHSTFKTTVDDNTQNKVGPIEYCPVGKT